MSIFAAQPAKRANMDGASIISTIGGVGSYAAPQMQMNPNENVVEVIVVPDNSVGLGQSSLFFMTLFKRSQS